MKIPAIITNNAKKVGVVMMAIGTLLWATGEYKE